MSSTAIMTIIDVIRNIMVANILQPYWTGICLTAQVIPQTLQYLNMGTIESLTVFVPKLRNQNNNEAAVRLKETVFTYTLFSSLAACLLVFLYMAVTPLHSYRTRILGVMAASVIVLAELKQFFMVQYATDQKFFKLGGIDIFFNIMVFV